MDLARLVAGDHAGEGDGQADHDHLDHDERRGAPIDLSGGDRRDRLAGDAVDIGLARRDRAQIEEREAERRMHERRLHVDAEQHAEPDQIDAEVLGGRAEERHDDEGELEEVEEEGQEEDEEVDDDQEADLPARQAGQQVLDPEMAVDAEEGQAEDARADQDEEDEGGELGRRIERLADDGPVQPAA